MKPYDAVGRETAVLDGGPGNGLRIRVIDRPWVLQVTFPCELETPSSNGQTQAHIQAIYVYRRDSRSTTEPVRYRFDAASP
ncbi:MULTISPECIES: hypothetical protein [unclassified Streptomyces]|uniref:hypothetical protein n=1 Tax=unclassified Streptomyces TaxID=2593676 RepID=UPI0022AF02E7|nr:MULTISPECIES: hypothetical protein [unclassified Streptomyces]MCZ4119218.1 hypothetical protein [Streptomyces sp. H39-S7]MDF9816670.1 hypothetical protein [Streptomyces sp. SPB162]